MSKIICDLCGTSYPETESQCPICGTAKTDTSKQPAAEEQLPVESVKPAKKEKKAKKEPAEKKAKKEKDPEEGRSNVGLIIVVVILLLAIIAVCVFIAYKFLGSTEPDPSGSTNSTQSTPAQTIPCQGITLALPQLVFSAPNQTAKLTPELNPANTTDEVIYESSDETVVTVNSKGAVVPVGNGTATITVRCGEYFAVCQVICENMTIPTDPTDPTDPTEPTEPIIPIELKLNRTDFTLSAYGQSHNLATGSKYSGPEDPSKITWTSSKPEVASVTDGKVVALSPGITYITAEYQGQTVKCKVICTKNVVKPPESDYKLTHVDFTMDVDDGPVRVSLVRKEDSGRVDVTLASRDESVCIIDEKGRVKAVGKGTTKVYVEYEGITYECIVRVTDKTPVETVPPVTTKPSENPAPTEPPATP